MNRSIGSIALCLLGMARVAVAYEYPLQFTPNNGARGLIVAGYMFDANNNVVGNCSYYTVSGGGGKGGVGRAKTYSQTCTWDLHGNLLTVTSGAMKAPAIQYTKGDLVVYAADANGDYTGTDKGLPAHGFVNSSGSHYNWLTPSSNALLHQGIYTLIAILKSDGDIPVTISNVRVSALHGIATLQTTDCFSGQATQINVDDKCSVTLTYDATQLTGAGVANDTLRIDVTSDAGQAPDFIQNFTIILPDNN